ncbi:protein phosphatase 2A regulatory B subunit [Pelagophyceae sp. CCMP2097]|nr:protein phosphatase 2A regulatory B subunit [Pelagophyceae sp. CCMP2097]|mmetsp:Transcript_16065/g.54863  ORF Transcript_16065/g.54863 Transcript_16065/m.54863 type:complete len:453 (+) Transcript_16065:179-1537(+)
MAAEPSVCQLEQSFDSGAKSERGEHVITAVEFDPTGSLLAMGDKGGRIVLLKRDEEVSAPRYAAYAAFKSHDSEFDYLKSLEIEEKINKIRFCKPVNSSTFLLSTNDKTIKLWKVGPKAVESVEPAAGRARSGGAGGRRSAAELRLPTVVRRGSVVAATARRVFTHAHAYHINSLSLNSDGETFISSDDLRVNLWSLERTETAFNIVDLKPANMEDLTEVITASTLHPLDCHGLAFSTSKGCVKLFDMRAGALCRTHAKLLHEAEPQHAAKSFFSEIVASISDVKFTPDGRFVVSRDYLALKVWDVRQERRPLRVVAVHDHLRPRLCDLYESDCIFDKFECASSPTGDRCATGSYSDTFHVFDEKGGRAHVQLDEAHPTDNARRSDDAAPQPPPPPPPAPPRAVDAGFDNMDLDFKRRVLHLAWHPKDDVLAVAGVDRLYVYSLPRLRTKAV